MKILSILYDAIFSIIEVPQRMSKFLAKSFGVGSGFDDLQTKSRLVYIYIIYTWNSDGIN